MIEMLAGSVDFASSSVILMHSANFLHLCVLALCLSWILVSRNWQPGVENWHESIDGAPLSV